MSGRLKNFYEIGQKIVCIGRNYREHAIELSNPIPEKPLIFAKTTNAYVLNGGSIRRPDGCKNMHYEVELGVVIGKAASKVPKSAAMDCVGGYCIALDMTARDWQDELKKAGHPWYLAKSFDTSCAIGEFVDKSVVSDPHNVEIYLTVNGQTRQKCKTDSMIFDIPTQIAYISNIVSLAPGDLVLTGTPAGVGECVPGDKLEIGITGITTANFKVT